MRTTSLLALALTLPFGCSSPGSGDGIHHVVFFTLEDPGQTQALLADSDARIPRIPGVSAYWSGTPHRTGRATVDGDYHVAVGMSFRDDAAYAAYLAHPIHEGLVATWQPRLASLRVHDVRREEPAR